VLPHLAAMERTSGSITAAMMGRVVDQPSRASNPVSMVTLRHGMKSLPHALAARLGKRFRSGVSVQAIQKAKNRWQLDLGVQGYLESDYVVIATPPWISAKLLGKSFPSLASELGEIQASKLRIVHFGFHSKQIQNPLSGTGFVVGSKENTPLEACTWSSQKWGGRAPQAHELIRCFLSKELPLDAPLEAIALKEISRLLGIKGKPLFSVVQSQDNVLPIYQIGHKTRVDRILSMIQAMPNMAMIGNTFGGLGLADCIASGIAATKKLVSTELLSEKFAV
jgi:protoporphyrinogen/coproporphyrinogen III oxidase